MRRVSSYLAFPPLPCESRAVYLCCTFPEVAFGGRYPLSLPYGARTFLTAIPFEAAARLSVPVVWNIVPFFAELVKGFRDFYDKSAELELQNPRG